MKSYIKPNDKKNKHFTTPAYQQRTFAKKCKGCGNEMWNVMDHISCKKVS